ncbi:hypothetical protein A3709_19905 [Halioglobus sp. HI00S01]|uniref:hypothetical protein n=1 Tax=Halioglobus sp. HI00S01 TaxID=1822214 RepID=UPI0007C2A7ED|nr:hypothetical protein [Halioglobus sp. HI00S01]KZX57890.1 hypothetical protein A3709_19905 [Halioglobus sp. HI00S01]
MIIKRCFRPETFRPRGHEWSKDDIRELVRLGHITARGELAEACAPAYTALKKDFPDLAVELFGPQKDRKTWSEQAIRDLVRSEGITRRVDLQKRHPGAYKALSRFEGLPALLFGADQRVK